MKLIYLMTSMIFLLILTSCSQTFDSVNPGLNNNNGLRVSVFDNIPNTDSSGSLDESSSMETINSDMIQIGINNNTSHNKLTDSDKQDINTNTLTESDKNDLINIEEPNSSNNVQILSPSIQGNSYIYDYLKPFIESLILKINSDKNLASSDLYLNVVYRGLYRDKNNNLKFITYNNLYDSLPDNSFFYGNNSVASVLLRYWQKQSSSLELIWNAYKKEVLTLGECKITNNTITKKVKDCTAKELLPLATEPFGNSKAIYYLFSSEYGNSASNHLFSEFIQKFNKDIDFTYASSVTSMKHLFETIPIFKTNNYTFWDYLNIKEDVIKKDEHLFLRKISKSSVSSAFIKQEINQNLGTDYIFYKDNSIYGGSLYYFENANHLISIILYCDKLWTNSLDQIVKNFVINSLVSFRNPTEISTSELSDLLLLK